MNIPTIRVRILHAGAPVSGEPIAAEEFVLGAAGLARPGPVDLLVVDARDRDPAAVAAALHRVGEWHREGAFLHAVLIWPKPSLEGVVLAIRAGIADVTPAAPSPLRLVRRLCEHMTRSQRRIVVQRLVRLWRLGFPSARPAGRSPEEEHAAHLADEQRAQYDRMLAEREALVAQREQELRATAARVQADLARASQACSFIELAAELRTELERRETELTLMAQQLSAGPEPEAPAPRVELRSQTQQLLETQQVSLDRRERALATRERWLRDYELALTGGRRAVN